MADGQPPDESRRTTPSLRPVLRSTLNGGIVEWTPMPRAGSLMHWLDLVHTRPGMYLGATPPDFGALLDRLEMTIVGYQAAVQAHGVRDPGVELYASFWQHLERRFGWTMSQSTIRVIRRESASDAEAWETYWRLLGEFRSSEGT